MADKVKFTTQITPIEDVGAAQQGGASSFISASETYGNTSGTGEITMGTGWDGTGSVALGYASGVRQYTSSASAATPTAFATLASADFLWIKNTGFQYASASALSAEATTNYVTVRALKGDDNTAVTGASGLDDGEQPIVAVLAPGEAICLPLRGLMSTAYFGHHATTVDGSTGAGHAIAVEVLTGT